MSQAAVTIIIIAICFLFGIGSRYVLHKPDNIIEETAEQIIKDKTGIDIDLSPSSPEESAKESKKKEKKRREDDAVMMISCCMLLHTITNILRFPSY